MLEISRDGKRIYFTNGLYTPWDEQFYPDGPFVIDGSVSVSAVSMTHSTHEVFSGHTTAMAAAAALGVHTLSYFTVMTTAAWLVYRKVGLAILRAAWFDMDRMWAVALLITGAVILFA